MNPSGIYKLVCNGEQGTLQLTVDANGNLVNSKVSLYGETDAISGQFNEIDGSIQFRVESDDHPELRFNGYVMTLEAQSKLAFAGTGSDYVPPLRGLAPAENHFGWWATLEPVNN
jgi:hypothetical protein